MSAASEYTPAPIAAASRDGNLAVGLLAGLAAAVLGALVWLALAMLLNLRIAFVGIGIGFAVGWAVHRFGGRATPATGVLSAALAVFGCALGHLLAIYSAVAEELDIGLWFTMRHAPFDIIRKLWLDDMTVITWLIFALAAWTAFRATAMRPGVPVAAPAAYPPPPVPGEYAPPAYEPPVTPQGDEPETPEGPRP